jgi:hypothetical protein
MRYLGIPIYEDRLGIAAFSRLKDKMTKRLTHGRANTYLREANLS